MTTRFRQKTRKIPTRALSVGKPIFNRFISGILIILMIMPTLSSIYANAQGPEKYPYTVFGRNGISINTSSLSVNGNMHTNKEFYTTAQNSNINGTLTTGNDLGFEERIKHVYADEKILKAYFTENCDCYTDAYTREDMNINMNKSTFSLRDISLNGNVSINNFNLGALTNIEISGQTLNLNTSAMYSKYGNITIDTSNSLSLTGLFYAPLGTITINALNVNLNNAVIIADKINITTAQNVNINRNDNLAMFIGTQTEEYNFNDLILLPNEWLGDSDSDGLIDVYELVIDTDPSDKDTDKDLLYDGYEFHVLGTDPLKFDTDGNGISDGYEDFDTDGLANFGEMLAGTKPFVPDTDNDGLLDGEEAAVSPTGEILTAFSDPLIADTDGDTLLDGEEVELNAKYGLNLRARATHSDGVTYDPDRLLAVTQTVEKDITTADGVITGITVDMKTNGYLERVLSVRSMMNIDALSSEVVGLVGEPFDFGTATDIDSATLTFSIDRSKLGDTRFNDIIVLWYDEENQKYVECSAENGFGISRNTAASTVSVTTTHFSQYMLVDSKAWHTAWEESFRRIYYTAPVGSGQPTQVPIDHYNTVFVIDTSGSMSDDPNGQWEGYDPIERGLRDDAPPKPPISDPAMDEYWLRMYGQNTCRRIEACENFINAMYPKDRAAIVTFSYDAVVQCGLTIDKQSLKYSLQNFSDVGGTCFSAGINRAVQLLKASGQTGRQDIINRIIFLSDGEPVNDTQDAINAAADDAYDNGIKIYTFGLGTDSGDAVLQGIADRTYGQFKKVIYATELERIINTTIDSDSGSERDFSNLMNVHSDDDGIPDIVEEYGLRQNGKPLGTKPKITDTDGDGLHDGREVLFDEDKFLEGIRLGDCSMGITLLSDPLKEDTDEDGLLDGREKYDANGRKIAPKDTQPTIKNGSEKLWDAHAARVAQGNIPTQYGAEFAPNPLVYSLNTNSVPDFLANSSMIIIDTCWNRLGLGATLYDYLYDHDLALTKSNFIEVCASMSVMLDDYGKQHAYGVVDFALNLRDSINDFESNTGHVSGAAKAVKDWVEKNRERFGFTEAGAAFLSFIPDTGSKTIYHSQVDSWQRPFGYNVLYDEAFDIGSVMDFKRFSFEHGDGNDKKEYILWGWKGDYWNLGAGTEIGLYKYNKEIHGTKHYDVVDYELPMTLYLYTEKSGSYENVFAWEPSINQWWITGFDPGYQSPKKEDLATIGTVQFTGRTDSKAMYDAFKSDMNLPENKTNKELLIFDDDQTVWVIWE